MQRGQDLFMVVLQSVGIIFKTSLGLRRGFLIKFLHSSVSIRMIGCLPLSLKSERILVHQPKRQLVESVERTIWYLSYGNK